jgi:hypothetical protein
VGALGAHGSTRRWRASTSSRQKRAKSEVANPAASAVEELRAARRGSADRAGANLPAVDEGREDDEVGARGLGPELDLGHLRQLGEAPEQLRRLEAGPEVGAGDAQGAHARRKKRSLR